MTHTSLLLGLLAALLVLVVIGAFHVSLRGVLTALFAPPRDAVQAGINGLAAARARLGAAAQRMRSDYHLDAPDRVGSSLAGIALYTLLFIIFALTEAAFNGAALAAIFGQGLVELIERLAGSIGLDANDAAGLLTVSILAQAALWFAVWTDLHGYSHLVPFSLFHSTRGLRWFTYAMLGLLAVVVFALAIFRLPVLLGDDLLNEAALATAPLPELSLAPTLLSGGEAMATAAPVTLPALNVYTPEQRTAVTFVTSALSVTTWVSAGMAGSVALPLVIVLLQLVLVYLVQALIALPQLLLSVFEQVIRWPFTLAFAAFVFIARLGVVVAMPLRYLPALAEKLDIDQPVIPAEPPAPPAETPDDDEAVERPEPAMYASPPSSGPDRNWHPYGDGKG